MEQTLKKNPHNDDRVWQIIEFIRGLTLKRDSKDYWKDFTLQFANILNTTFTGGSVLFDKKRNVAAYKDSQGYIYDYLGIREDNESKLSDFVPIECLGSAKVMFTNHLRMGTNPNERRALMVRYHYEKTKKEFNYDELVEIVKEYGPKVFAEYDIRTDDPFQIMYYKLVIDKVIREDLWKEGCYVDIAWEEKVKSWRAAEA